MTHGGLRIAELRELGIDPASVLDFSANVNPLGPSPRVREALLALDLSRYPDPESLDLRAALAERHGVAIDQVWVGNGATELIHLIARAFLRVGDVAAVLQPTFGEYEHAALLAGAKVSPAPGGNVTSWNTLAIAGQLRNLRPTLTFCCNPNNPTGQYLSEADVRSLVEAASPGTFVLDEAYSPFVENAWDSRPLLASDVVILRSLTKDLGLAGLRLGYVIAREEHIAAIRALQPAWSVNAAAQAAGLAALHDDDHTRCSRRAIAGGRDALLAGLDRIGVSYTPPAANFVLAFVGNAAKVRLALLRRGFAARDCASFGLPEHIRIAVRTAPENEALIDALAAALGDAR